MHKMILWREALVANEVVGEYTCRGKRGLVFKIDFPKAYDHVDWGFLDLIWRKMEEMIRGCLSSVSFLVMINGRPRGKFRSSTGLRQDDLLSPFLFNLVGDGLSRLVERAKSVSHFKWFLVGKDKVEVSHLHFAGDTVFFINNDADHFKWLVATLRSFCSMS